MVSIPRRHAVRADVASGQEEAGWKPASFQLYRGHFGVVAVPVVERDDDPAPDVIAAP